MPEFDYCVNLQTDAGEMYSLLLPRRLEGSYQFPEDSISSFLRIESREGQWYACCSAPAFFEDCEVSLSNAVRLGENRLYSIEAEFGSFKLHVIPITRDDLVYRNYFMVLNAEIRIGSSPNCEIRYAAPFCAPVHAVMRRDNGVWSIRDCGSEYGTYVNGKRIRTDVSLHLGDQVFIAGMRMIVGTDFLSMSAGRDIFDVSKNVIRELPGSGYSRYSGQNITAAAQEFYNRMPRVPMTMKERTIGVEGPPMSMARSQMPLMLRMGSSVVMGGMSALAGNFTMLLSSVLFPFLSSKYTDEQKQKYEHLRNVKYREYLEMKRQEIIAAQNDERDFLNKKYPSLMTMMEKVPEKENLWERRTTDSDFLHLRIGQGEQAMSTVIDYPQKSFELEPDELEEEMYRLTAKKYMLSDAPVILPLMEDRICSLTGDSDNARELLLHMVHQIAALHSYDEVKMMFLCGRNDVELLEVVRYLPHVWDDHKRIRFVAVEESEAFRLGEYLQAQLPEDMESEKELKQILKNRPYYVLFALNRKLFESLEVLKRVMHSDHHHGISIVTSFDRLPKECKKIVTLPASGVYEAISLTEGGGGKVCFTGDYCSRQLLEAARRTIANTQIRTMEDAEALPKMVTFLEMFRAGRIEHLNPLKRWHENNPVSSLAVPVGIGTDGMPFMLDLHEKHHGPHGLVAGMTGSGKSEFLITYILSLAVNFHPDEVSFVLIDYKGGGLAGAFENTRTGVRLPHLVGTITNLDGNTIRRSLISLESELKRRQQEFNDVKSLINEGTMDIYDYQKLYRAGKIKKPMPHLFIISDEFAELKQQQPEFIEKLISIARIGRSLGIHLILATQKPSGVVNDQIRSNTKFRACLRVQDRADSMDMLKRPEAAELTDTGRFYLQVGYNEYFALAQSAWCGAPYEPQEVIRPKRDDSIEVVDSIGQRIAKAKPKVMRKDSGMRQLVAIVQFLYDLAQAQGIVNDPLWEEELPDSIDLAELTSEDGACPEKDMTISIGKVDDPEQQTQYPLQLDFEECKNILVTGLPGSGKTTVVESILWALTEKLSPKDLNFYLLDYSSRMLKNFEPLPHCGAVLLEEDDNRLDDFFGVIQNIIHERKRLFSQLEVDSFKAARTVTRLPLVLVVIDNIAGLSGSKRGEAHNYALPSYIKNSYTYGVQFIITCSRTNELSSKVRTELGEKICLNLKEKYDYTDVLGCKAMDKPPELPGRGLCRVGDRALEYQAAKVYATVDDKKQVRELKNWVRSVCGKYGIHTDAKTLAVNDVQSEYAPFAEQFEKGRFPLGIAKDTSKAVALPLRQFSLLSLYFGVPQAAAPIWQNMLFCAEREKMEVWIVKRRCGSLFDSGKIRTDSLTNVDFCSATAEDLTQVADGLKGIQLMQERVFAEYCERNGILAGEAKVGIRDYPEVLAQITPLFLLIESAEDFLSALDTLLQIRFQAVLLKRKKLHLYIVIGFEPDLPQKLTRNSLYDCFRNDNILFFGGNSGRQSLLNTGDMALESKKPFNEAQMYYRGQLHGLVMPCGKIEYTEEPQNQDLESIF